MISYQFFSPHLKAFNVADLLYHAMKLLNFPMLIMQLLEIGLAKGVVVRLWQEEDIMAQLVF